ncbi:hypothetical protein evm_008104 [Chilo suppressalis]|nr:hypothetical protein evm_008104 [Chilo suppressalis]
MDWTKSYPIQQEIHWNLSSIYTFTKIKFITTSQETTAYKCHSHCNALIGALGLDKMSREESSDSLIALLPKLRETQHLF